MQSMRIGVSRIGLSSVQHILQVIHVNDYRAIFQMDIADAIVDPRRKNFLAGNAQHQGVDRWQLCHIYDFTDFVAVVVNGVEAFKDL